MSEKSTALCADRYHAVMGDFLLGVDPAGTGKVLGDEQAVFYVTQRKLPYAPAVGHPRMVDLLNRSRADEPRARFLREDRANLKLIAERLKHSRFPGDVDAVPEGTIVFAGEPIALVSGPSAVSQMFEVAFEYAFDEPMTWAYIAGEMKKALGPNIFLSDFSLRRAGSLERATEASKYLYIGGCDDTSDLEAAFQYGIPSVGTMAHYLVQLFMAYVSHIVNYSCREIPPSWRNEDGKLKHGQRLCFEYWLDKHPKGTTCLVDTITLELGMIHLIEAALSSLQRRDALKGARIDSYKDIRDFVREAIFARRMFDANGLEDKKIVLTGDLNAERAKEINRILKEYQIKNVIPVVTEIGSIPESIGIMGEAIGTKAVAEVDRIAGVIFKMVEFCGIPTLKLSLSPGKETLPGKLQIWRCEDKDGRYVLDEVCPPWEHPTMGKHGIEFIKSTPLIQPFWRQGSYSELKTPQELKAIVEEEKSKFCMPLERYAKERVILSPGLSELKEMIRLEYLQTPPTKVKMAEWPE